jgi:tRNA(Ile)-lysidine synthetase-like protein
VHITVSSASHPSTIGRSTIHLAAGPWELRAATAGERIELATGSKLVRDAMAESWIPSRLRSEWPVLAQHERIGWIAGSRVAPWAHAEPQSLRVLTVTMERIAL